MWDWKNDRRVHFAIGVAVFALAVKWLFTGSLLYSVEVLQGGVTQNVWDSEGNVKAVPVSTVTEGVMPIVFDFAVTIFVAIGARVLVGGLAIFNGVQSVIAGQSKPVEVAPELRNVSQVAASESEQDRMRSAVIDLGRAAAANDAAAMESLRIALRQPQALRELQEAYRANDLDLANKLNAELAAMIEPKAARKRGSNVQ